MSAVRQRKKYSKKKDQSSEIVDQNESFNEPARIISVRNTASKLIISKIVCKCDVMFILVIALALIAAIAHGLVY